MNQIGGLGIDQEMAKSFQRILTKQHMQFKLGTKVLGAQKTGGKIIVNVENVKSAKKEEVQTIICHFRKLTVLAICVIYSDGMRRSTGLRWSPSFHEKFRS